MKKNRFVKRVKKLSPYVKNKFINSFSYLLILFLSLGINYLFIFGAFIPKIFILDLCLMILSVAPIFFFKGTMFDRIWLPLILFFILFLLTANVNNYMFSGTIFSIKDIAVSLKNTTQALIRLPFLHWKCITINCVMFTIFLIWILVFNIKLRFRETKTKKYPSRKKITIFASGLTISSLIVYECSMGIFVLDEQKRGINSIKNVNFNAMYHFQNLGMISYYNREIRQNLWSKNWSDNQMIDYLSKPELINDNFTGLLKDQKPNVFTILLETGDTLILNEKTTPNLCNFFKDGNGVFSKHNYSINKTNVTNALSFAGNSPTQLNFYNSYKIPYALPNVLKKQGYNTRFYHDTTIENDCYDDYNFMKNYGFDNFIYHDTLYKGTDIKPWKWEDTWFHPDSWTMNGIIKNLDEFQTQSPSTPFYSQWMSMFMHMDNVVNNKNKANVDKLYEAYGEDLKKFEQEGTWVNPCTDNTSRAKYELFTLKVMDFDYAFGQLLDYLYGENSTPYLKNTILVVFGDHAWYELDGNNNWMCKQVKKINDYSNINLYSTVLGIYHPKLKDKIQSDTSGLFIKNDIQKMSTPACITPTILDLLGVPYNQKLFQDRSLFDLYGLDHFDKNNHELFYSTWLNYYMDEHYSSNNGGTITSVIDDNNSQKEFLKKLKAKEEQLLFINSLYNTNFFSRHDLEEFLP